MTEKIIYTGICHTPQNATFQSKSGQNGNLLSYWYKIIIHLCPALPSVGHDSVEYNKLLGLGGSLSIADHVMILMRIVVFKCYNSRMYMNE